MDYLEALDLCNAHPENELSVWMDAEADFEETIEEIYAKGG